MSLEAAAASAAEGAATARELGISHAFFVLGLRGYLGFKVFRV